MGCEKGPDGESEKCILSTLFNVPKVSMWHETGHRAEVTCILRSPQKDSFAVGYADGSIRLWTASAGSVITTFNGHKKAVTALAFDEQGTRLASGSQDTDLIVWDVVSEAGLFRFVSSHNSWAVKLNSLCQSSWAPRPNHVHQIHYHLE
jgi:WD40 repeat protein